MKPTKRFLEWYKLYGLMYAHFNTLREYSWAKAIAWRAYRRGVHDAKRDS